MIETIQNKQCFPLSRRQTNKERSSPAVGRQSSPAVGRQRQRQRQIIYIYILLL